MKGYISGLSAAKIWNIPYLDTVIGNTIIESDGIVNRKCNSTSKKKLDCASMKDPDSTGIMKHDNAGMKTLDGSGIAEHDCSGITELEDSNIEEPDNTEITVLNYNARFRINGKKVRSKELPLPNGAIKIVAGNKVASPELVFLELACKLSIHRLILLGLQLCSHKSGSPSEAITTKQKLNKFLAKTAWHRGHRKAIRAVKYVENGSRSIMESLSYMMLCLPYALGGYGLSGAVFNYEIKIGNEAFLRLAQDRCFIDLYYKHAKLGVEYDSFAHHNSPSEQAKDAIRSSVQKRQCKETMHLSTVQLYDRKASKDFAYNLASHLGKRIHIRTKKFEKMHMLIRELLPTVRPGNET